MKSRTKKSGVYLISGPNGRFYVGQSIDLANRWGYHKYHLRHGIHKNGKLQNAWNKHGEDKFSFKIVLLCRPEELTANEQQLMVKFDSVAKGYNISVAAESTRGTPNPRVAERNRRLKGSDHPSWGIKRPDLAERNRLYPPCKGKRWKPNRKPTPIGENHGAWRNNPLHIHDATIIRLIKEGRSLQSLARQFGSSAATMMRIRDGYRRRKA